MGKEGKYDLKLADPPPMTETESDSDSDDNNLSEVVIEPVQADHPAKLIRTSTISALKVMSIIIGLDADEVSMTSANNFSACLGSLIEKSQNVQVSGFQDESNLLACDQANVWATLGFVRAIAKSSRMCQILAQPSWINLLLKIVEAKPITDENMDLSNQILALRLLAVILPHFDNPGSGSSCNIQDRLFKLLGHTALMCRIDGSHFGDQGLLQKVRKGRGTRVALTASHSSTIVNELVHLLRILHTLPEWSSKINDYICLKLSLIHEIGKFTFCYEKTIFFSAVCLLFWYCQLFVCF